MLKEYHYKISILLLVLSSLACSTLLPKSAQSHPPGSIVFQTNHFGNSEIILIQLDDYRAVRLTDNSANDFSPTYISATDQIGFISDRENDWGLYTMSMSGENVTEIMSQEKIALDYPAWSDDGNFIAASLVEDCDASRTECNYDIYTMDDSGKSLKNLTETADSEWVPDWSPDGQKVAFASDRDGDAEVYIMNKDGSNLEKLTDNSGYDGRPRWSPDGKKISFETDREGPDWDIYVMNVDGSDPQPVTINTTNEFSQSWSPDGNWLVYVSDADGDNELLIIDINGQNQFRLTNNSDDDISPIWAP